MTNITNNNMLFGLQFLIRFHQKKRGLVYNQSVEVSYVKELPAIFQDRTINLVSALRLYGL